MRENAYDAVVIAGGHKGLVAVAYLAKARPRSWCVGKLTSASHSFRLNRNIGYAWVPIELSAPGNQLELESPDGPVPAVTAALPFVDPREEIPKS